MEMKVTLIKLEMKVTLKKFRNYVQTSTTFHLFASHKTTNLFQILIINYIKFHQSKLHASLWESDTESEKSPLFLIYI